MTDAADQPITLKILKEVLEETLDRKLDEKFDEKLEPFAAKIINHVEARMAQDRAEQTAEITEEMKYYFDAAVEKIEEDLKGANHDQISLLENKKDDHEERITALESKVGLR